MAMRCKEVLKSIKAIKMSLGKHQCDDNTNPSDDDDLNTTSKIIQDTHSMSDVKLNFLETHPGQQCTKLSKLQNYVVPMMYYGGGRMCPMVKLHLHNNDCNKDTCEMHEDYAKIALLMLYLFCKLEDIQLDGSCWKLFTQNCNCLRTTKLPPCG
jgi:hypothetical protein